MALRLSVLVFSFVTFWLAAVDAKKCADWKSESGFKYDKDKTKILAGLDKVEMTYLSWLRGDDQHRMVTLRMEAKSCEISYVAEKALIRLDTFIDKQISLGHITKADADQVREELEGVTNVYIPQLQSFLNKITSNIATGRPLDSVTEVQETFKGYRESLVRIVDGLYTGLTDVMKTHFEDE
ncbi:hypothetical protein HDE_04336 [Halotydeus destructor]|nr:hypothetical protein HDE_04336 [Halotydeus destructor]